MKSRTSFFNGTVFKKDVTRFAPVWGIYLIGLLLIIHGLISDSQPQNVFSILEELISVMACINFAYALLTAQVLFGDLFNARLCNALHAMPMRREGWFLTHLAAGMCFSFVPNLVAAVSFIPVLDYYWSSVFFWLLAVQLQYLFFFAVAVFCVFCTGNRFAMAVFYGLLNFFSLMAGGFAEVAYQPLLYGVELGTDWMTLLSPVCYMAGNSDWFAWYDKITRWHSECWPYLDCLSVIAVVLLGVSVVLYRRRKLECAGDFIAVKPLGPLFHVAYTLTAGLIFQLFESIFVGNSEVGVFMIVGLAVGFFTGRMLLQRTVRVFQWKAFAALGILIAGVLGSMLVVRLDPAGVTRMVPDEATVRKVTVNNWNTEVDLEDPAQIARITQIHRQVIEQREQLQDQYGYTAFELEYELVDGSKLCRSYKLPEDHEIRTQLVPYFSAPEVVLLQYEEWDRFLSQVYQVQVDYRDDMIFTGEDAKELVEAIRQDCLDGTMAQSWDYQLGDVSYVCDLQLVVGENVNDIFVYSNSVNTRQWLEDHGWDFE